MLIISFSNCGKTYLKIYLLIQKQEQIFIITKSINQYLIIKAQTIDEIQPIENYENSIVAFDDMLLSKQESNVDLFFFTRGRHNNIDINYISQGYFHLPKDTILNNCNTIILFKRNLRDVILLFHDVAGLDMKLEEWKKFCRKPWEKDYGFFCK